MAEKIITSRSVHIIYGVLFAAIAIAALFALLAYRSFTESGTQSSTVTNVSSSIDNVYTADTANNYTEDSSTSFTISENSSKSIYVHGQATDNNGCDDIVAASSTWALVLYNSDTTYAACKAGTATDKVNCYYIANDAAGTYGSSFATANCTAGGGSEEINYRWTVPLTYYTDYTDGSPTTGNWTAVVEIVDDYLSGTTNTSSTASDSYEINRTSALDVNSAALNFGSLSLGGAASATSSIVLSNTANGAIDLSASGSDFSCDVGRIAIDNLKFDSALSAAYASMAFSATSTGTTLTTLNLNPQTSSSSSTKDTSWALKLPSAGSNRGAGGSCSTSITISATETY